MKTFRNILLLTAVASVLNSTKAGAQCAAGKMAVTITATTDDYPEETYWQLVPGGNACGNGTLASGGNLSQVGCNGGGKGTATQGNGYPNKKTDYTTATLCLDSGVMYTIRSVDSYGDGGTLFTVRINGLPIYKFKEATIASAFNFTVKAALPYDVGVTGIKTYGYVQGGNVVIAGDIFNSSANTITGMNLNYQVDGNPVVTQPINSLSIAPFTSYSFTHPTPWNVSTKASYNVKVWADNLNGNADMNHANDTGKKMIVVGDPTPNIIDATYKNRASKYTVIANSSQGIAYPNDLDFHPTLSNYELWVINRGTEASGGKTVTIRNAGKPGQTSELLQDGNAWHFMSLPTAIAFSENGNFGTTPGVLDANHSGGKYTGPTLWSSNPAIYAKPSGGNGSHIDMLHESPFSMGMASEADNAFWVFDSYNKHIARFDFAIDHGPGNDDHSDGRVRRYQDFEVTRIDDLTPSHVILDKTSKWLYIVDNGNKRLLRLNTATGSVTGTFQPMENIAETSVITGATWETLPSPNFQKPCGIELVGDRLLVGDNAGGGIQVYDVSVNPVKYLYHISAPIGLTGIKVGPDGLIYYTNNITHEVVKLESFGVGIDELKTIAGVSVYPNPATGKVLVQYVTNEAVASEVSVMDMQGRLMDKFTIAPSMGSHEVTVDLTQKEYAAGMYVISVTAGVQSFHRKLTVE